MLSRSFSSFFFFFNATATPEIYTLSLHDALPIYRPRRLDLVHGFRGMDVPSRFGIHPRYIHPRSEEHTSELQSRRDLVCRLLLEKKKKKKQQNSELTITYAITLHTAFLTHYTI